MISAMKSKHEREGEKERDLEGCQILVDTDCTPIDLSKIRDFHETVSRNFGKATHRPFHK